MEVRAGRLHGMAALWEGVRIRTQGFRTHHVALQQLFPSTPRSADVPEALLPLINNHGYRNCQGTDVVAVIKQYICDEARMR